MGASAPKTSTRDAILRSAARIFAQLGYRAATMQAIAADAGFTPPTLYAHFGSKQGIFEALVELLMGDLYATMERALPEGLSLSQRLELRIGDVLDLAQRQRDTFALFILRPYDLPDLAPERDDHELLQGYWERIFDAHRAELGDRTPTEAALLLSGLLYAWVQAWLRTGDEELPGDARRLVDLVMNGLGGG